MIKKILVSGLLLLLISPKSGCQTIDSTSFSINTRYSFYSFEKSGEVLVHVPQNLVSRTLSVTIKTDGTAAGSWKGIPGRNIIRVPILFDLPPHSYKITALITVTGKNTIFVSSSDLDILSYKPNEVKTDRLTGGLIVNKKQFFPFGFYCYSPVYPTLPEEEAVKGFNMISPYQKILPATFNERKAYMDRCAQLGMKVHYNLLSISGGGGVGSESDDLTGKQNNELLVNEINAFRDHPALLAWYIADEPTAKTVSPDSLFKIYKMIKEIDPWHPVSVVFMAPFLSSLKYAGDLDIIMADPYPIPENQVTLTGNVASQLLKEFAGKKPVWIVPQAFGGGELWKREPTLQEIRSMTYQSIINGARGIQYFVRQGLNLFPKSTGTWGECGKMAVEIAELTPWLLSDETTIRVSTGSQNIMVYPAVHNDQLLILAVNKINEPLKANFIIGRSLSGKIKVLFENRSIDVNNGVFNDQLSALGSQAYMFDMKPHKEIKNSWSGNLIVDPGFEDTSSPGVPASCYARNSGDRGATYFLDSREFFEGSHSIRLITPVKNSSVKLRFFPVSVRPGASYIISIRAKADPEQIPGGPNAASPYFEISMGDFGTSRFQLENGWSQYITIISIPYENNLPLKTNIILQMPSAGVAWFDLLQVAECADIVNSRNPGYKLFEERL